jgi:predicted GNAT family N-acyltransferase
MLPDVRRATTAADRTAAYALRREVFVVEQDVPEDLERDELDESGDHVVAFDVTGACVGTGRLVIEGASHGRIGRMAVAGPWRSKGLGAALLAELEAIARERGLRSALLHAQIHAERFYRRAGYVRDGEPFDEAGIAHVVMRKALTPR